MNMLKAVFKIFEVGAEVYITEVVWISIFKNVVIFKSVLKLQKMVCKMSIIAAKVWKIKNIICINI